MTDPKMPVQPFVDWDQYSEETSQRATEVETVEETVHNEDVQPNVESEAHASEPQAETVSNAFNAETLELLNEIKEQVTSVEKTIELHHFNDNQQQKVIDTLHEELMYYKDNAYKEQLMPLIKGIISTINMLQRRVREYKKLMKLEQEEIENKRAQYVASIDELEFVIDELEGVLYPYNIDRLDVKIGDTLHLEHHKVISKVTTTNAELDRTIEEVVRRGYIWENRVVEKASVICRVCDN